MMPRPKLSLIIPYRQRLENLRSALQSLVHQTMDPAEFEVVIGAMEYDEAYVTACREVADRIRIVTVMTNDAFEIPIARNIAMRQAAGEVIVNIDADTLLPPDALTNLYERHYAFGQAACVVGQVLGYGNNYDGDVEHVDQVPFATWQDRLIEMADTRDVPRDPRFQVDHVIPWSFAWTGFIALPADLIRRHDLYFDESLRGWGVDDIEWGYRISAEGIPIVLRKDVWALHLPHIRDTAANFVTEGVTYRQFLHKFPGPDVELAAAFSDFEANGRYLEFKAALAGVVPSGAAGLGTVLGTSDGVTTVFCGASLDKHGQVTEPGRYGDIREVLPLIGLALPYPDGIAEICRIAPPIQGLSDDYRKQVHATASRVARTVIVE
ncbi:glycosyltransferase family 2 protein [Actinoplanes sp. NPDC049599]|uniref:glycosyltransferase family 2 protein n=1 Tax=Actinoplanes sp. NPDC049599 TaxID=3363903 RepID=UPI0037B77C6F